MNHDRQTEKQGKKKNQWEYFFISKQDREL